MSPKVRSAVENILFALFAFIVTVLVLGGVFQAISEHHRGLP